MNNKELQLGLMTDKQKKMLIDRKHKWNFHTGATRSGKTFGTYYLVPIRIQEIQGIEGQCVMIGKTLGTLLTNVINPLRNMYGNECVSQTWRDGGNRVNVTIFGRDFLCVGADNALAHNKIRGGSILYCYGDEVATWHPSMFHMLESRLDRKESRFDGTNNPDDPNHWLKKFFEKGEKEEDIDINIVHYTIDDNQLLDEDFKKTLKAEYRGTVYYDRFILGKWVKGEGAIYKKFNKEQHVKEFKFEDYLEIRVGVDYGETDATVFTAVGIGRFLKNIDVVKTYYHKNGQTGRNEKNINEYINDFVIFINELNVLFPNKIKTVKIDSANKSFIKLAQQRITQDRIRNVQVNAVNKAKENISSKSAIQERIDTLNMMLIGDYLRINPECKELIEAIQGAVYDDKGIRLDDKTVNVDSLDSFEYAWKDYIKEINQRQILNMGGKK